MASPPPPPPETNLHASAPANSESSRDNLQYYVVSEFKDMQSFEQIKNIIPNALITNLEKEMKIQLGVFDNEIDANNLVEKLRQQQINSSVYDSSKLPQ
jgi:cell division septation protein DedD